ncbi:MAG: class I SAM-dependent methyltransferase [Rhodocyclaceae bacterium]|nr:class I SAM-dependent methyltransferase [Rhodocyclaceae bacterium]MCA3073735.1 class I SAM-dependent methyltransferase [Rhodocyclaceae bacterium]MCA3091718.1 class I SAM-dependent methyltransferase [Rhodocyclaceae bacterium]MCA3093388.1 class I SAM-dependent methyltransferase [Rhodocyclaceae bacterium]MCA3096205.1 class I SAM-dependent methyltransferase [Rhodocyclaceae bacterium]
MMIPERLLSLARRLRDRRHARTDPTRNPGCSAFEVDCRQLSRFVQSRLVPRVGFQPFPAHELLLMSAAVCRLKPKEIFEWGTNLGKSAWIFARTAQEFSIDTTVHSVDLPDEIDHAEHPRRRRGEMVRDNPRVCLHLGDGLNVSLALWRSGGCTQRPLFMIDGDHSYASVLRELTGIAEAVPDAAILLHDTFFQSSESGYNVGPDRAIVEVMERFPQRWRRIDSGLGLPGMSLLHPDQP